MLLIPSADEEAFVFGGAGTELLMATDGMGKAHFEISEATDGSARAWVVRLHLLPNQIVTEAVLDGAAMAEAERPTTTSPLGALAPARRPTPATWLSSGCRRLHAPARSR
jgi:hypothetical protein